VQELQLTNVDFELDAKKVVDYFHRGSSDVSEFGAILEECKRCRNLYFENSKVEFRLRQANEVAHIFNVVPLCISTMINNEKL
jgi:hypothetical protein